MKKTPIAFFAYKRPDHTLRALESLTQNEAADQSELFIFCDGPKRPEDRVAVSQARKVVRSRQWCGQVHITEREENWGLAQSIISGVTEICARYGRVIVLEDDLILSPYFLSYMNNALEKYEQEPKVMHISGYMFPVKAQAKLPETFFIRTASCWGWATWQRAWQYFEHDSTLLIEKIQVNKLEKEFSIGDSYPFFELLKQQNTGSINSWAIRWYASVFLAQGLCLHPRYSLVRNIGHDNTGTHCGSTFLFDVDLTNYKPVSFSGKIVENNQAIFASKKYFMSMKNNRSILLNLFNKIKNIKNIKNTFNKIHNMEANVTELNIAIEKLQEAVGRIEKRQLQTLDVSCIHTNEFRVFSQWGEDGIIQFLIDRMKVEHKIFVEFGVQNYKESNTRFLLINNNWSGLIIDSNEKDISYVKKDPIYWQYNIKAIQAFITKDNINNLIKKNGLTGDIGLLSIDIDGNDYWVWQAINVVNPAIVVIEYNHRFGKDKAVTIPYDENFVRSQVHHSGIYFGASLKALYLLAQKKGYAFVGCNSAGNNAFFVRNDLKPDSIKKMSIEEGYVAGQFRESRNEKGELNYLSPQEERKFLASLPLVYID